MDQKKQYRSALRSRRLIRQAFLELLREKKFEKITVTDIVKRADINRSTFYAHYPDVLGLVEELVNDVVDKSLELVARTDTTQILHDPMPFLSELTAIGDENMDIYRLLGQSDFALHQVDKMKALLVERTMTTVEIPEAIRNSSGFRIHIHFFIGGLLNIYQQWLQGNLDCSMDEISRQLAVLISQTETLCIRPSDVQNA